MRIGLLSAGHMGSGLGHALREGGHEVITTLAGRSARTARLARSAGLTAVPSLVEIVATAQILLVVTPPGEAIAVASDIAAAAAASDHRPLVADLNAVSPSTMDTIGGTLAAAGLDLVDGSISGAPPTVRPGARIFLSGPRAPELAALNWPGVTPIVVPGPVGAASAVKMCTASVYKGLTGLFAQAIRTADRHGVLEQVLADLARAGFPDVLPSVAVAATKAHRYVPEMREISATQGAAGLLPDLFAAFAEVYEGIAATPLAEGDPETVDRDRAAEEVVTLLRAQSVPGRRT